MNARLKNMIDFVKLIHLAAAIFWMGGMAFMLLALRPAAAALLQQPERLMMMGAVWKRFFFPCEQKTGHPAIEEIKHVAPTYLTSTEPSEVAD